jgi:PIN domain nuclease of toxin-antitoxin system
VILLDTHVAVWMTTDKKQLSAAAAAAIRDGSRAGQGVAIAGSTLWEIAMITGRGGFRLPSTLAAYLRYLESVFVVLPITGAIAEISISFSDRYPKNPIDRLIGATAVAHGLRLVTKDEGIRASGEVECIW